MIFKIRQLLVLAIIFLLLSCSDDDSSGDNQVPTLNAVLITLGGDLNDSAQSVVSTNDGGFIVLGYTQSDNGDITDKQDTSFDYWVLKFNAQSELQWNKTFGGSGDDRGRTIIQTQDGGYAILGTSSSNDGDVSGNSGMQDYWLAKLDASGVMLWQKSFGFSGADTGISLIETNDQGFLLTGVLDVTASGGLGNTSRSSEQQSNSTSTSRHAGGDYWAIKLNSTGNLEWSHYYGGNFTDTPEGIVQTEDDGFIIVGGSDSADTDVMNNIGTYDFWVIKISNAGELLWEKSFGGDEIDEARAIVSAADGNYVIAGDTRSQSHNVSNNNGAADLWLIKISPEGDLLWETSIGGTDFDVARALVKTQDNGFLLAGSSRSSNGDVSANKGQNDAWVLKVDANGNLLWETTVGGSNIDFAYGVAALSDGSVVAVGDTNSSDGDISENKGFTDLLVININ